MLYAYSYLADAAPDSVAVTLTIVVDMAFTDSGDHDDFVGFIALGKVNCVSFTHVTMLKVIF